VIERLMLPLSTPVPIKSPRFQSDIIYELFIRSNLSPYASSVLIQIILNDLRPLLSPLPPEAMSFTLALSNQLKPVPQLDIFTAMSLWDPAARVLHRIWGNVDLVMDEIEQRGGGAGRRQKSIVAEVASFVGLVQPGVNLEVCEPVYAKIEYIS
jgi:hypothetical protein